MEIKRVLRVGRSLRGKYRVELQELEDGSFKVEAWINGESQLTCIRYTYADALARYQIEFNEDCYGSNCQETIKGKES